MTAKNGVFCCALVMLVACQSLGMPAPAGAGRGPAGDIPAADLTCWPMFAGTPERSSFSPSTGPVEASLLWSTQLSTGSCSAPTVADGVYYQGTSRRMVALNTSDGKQRWSFDLPSGTATSAPLVCRGRLFFGANWGDGSLYAINASDGKQVWRKPVGDMYTTSPLAVGDLIITATNNKGIFALNWSDGTKVWSSSRNTYMHSSICFHRGVVYGAASGSVYALNASDGQELWSTSYSGGSGSSLVWADGMLLIHCPGVLLALDADGGRELWRFTAPEDTWNAVTSTPAVGFGVAFFGVQQGGGDNFYAVDMATGSKVWNASLGGDVIPTPAVASNGVVYVSCNRLYALDVATGGLVWSYDTPAAYGHTIANGSLYYATGWSAMAFYGPLPVAGPPGAPRSLSAKGDIDRIFLSWSPPGSNGGHPIEKYIVHRGDSSGALARLANVTDAENYMDGQVVNGHRYYYKVSAVNQLGEGPASGEVSAMPGQVPSEPRNLKASATDRKVSLTWEPPTRDGNCPVTAYNIYRRFSTGDWLFQNATGNGTAYVDAGLMNGKNYYYRVSALNVIGEGPQCQMVGATPCSVPDAPVNLKAEPGDSFVRLTWESPPGDGGSPVTGFRVFGGTAGGGGVALRTLDIEYSFVDRDLPNGTARYYQVAAINALGEGSRSAQVNATPRTVPWAPLNPSAAPGPYELTIGWQPPVFNGGAPLLGYRLYRLNITGAYDLLNESGDGLIYVDRNLAAGVTYTYRVSAFNVAGEGARSEPVAGQPLSVASAPLGLNASGGDRRVGLSWYPPSTDGGAPLTGYRLYRNGTLLAQLPVGAYCNTYLDASVENDMAYSYRVAAVNPVGEGPASAEVVFTPRPSLVVKVLHQPAKVHRGEKAVLEVAVSDPDGRPLDRATVTVVRSDETALGIDVPSSFTGPDGKARFNLVGGTVATQKEVQLVIHVSKQNYLDNETGAQLAVLASALPEPGKGLTVPFLPSAVAMVACLALTWLLAWRKRTVGRDGP